MKVAYCDKCGSDKSIFDATRTDNDEPIWKCRCCNHEMKRRVLATKSKEIRAKKQEKLKDLMKSLLDGTY